jgi:hypothetical protein
MSLVKKDAGCKEGRNYPEDKCSKLPQNIGTYIPEYICVKHPQNVILRGIFLIIELA